MYHSSFSKKLKPAKRAWRSFTTKLKSKLHDLNIPKTIKTTTQNLLSFCSRRFFIPFKKRFLTKPSHGRGGRRQYYNNLYSQYHQKNYLQQNFASICIDHLYSEPPPPRGAERRNNRGKEVVEEEEKGGLDKKSLYSVEDAWNAVVASSPQLRGVDERADDFIYKFREDMKLQKEKSLLEYQQMLARSS